jgi:lysophospholipase L1-like esterase
MKRRTFLAAALLAPLPLGAAPDVRRLDYLLLGDSEAYLLARPLRAEMRLAGLTFDVDARGGSSVRQWKKKWFEKSLRKHKPRTVLISCGVNCTRVERPVLARDVQELVLMADDMDVTPVWLLPPPLPANTKYLFDAVAASEVFAFAPGPLPLQKVRNPYGPGWVDDVHPTPDGFKTWAREIADVMWG